MEIQAECDCGNELSIESVTTSSNSIWITVEKCPKCEKENYEAGEANAKQEQI